MNTETIPALKSNLDKYTETQLRTMLSKYLGLTVTSLQRSAKIVQELDKRGIDLSDMNAVVLQHLRRIADKQLLPQLLIGWRETPIFAYARYLPTTIQAGIVANKPIQVITLKEGGKVDEWQCEPRNMPANIARQVFARDHIRDEAEQVAYLRGKQPQQTRPDPLPYVISGKIVLFNKPCRLTLRDLKGLVKSIER